MAIDLTVEMPSKVGAATGPWPFGEPRNVSAPGAGDGTPWRQDLGKDIIGFLHSLLDETGISPSGTSDTATVSQYRDALKQIIQEYPELDEVLIGNKLTIGGATELPIEEDVSGLTGSNDNVILPTQDLRTNFKVISTDALIWTGLTAPDTTSDDRLVILKRTGGTSFTLNHEDVASVAANRFDLPGGANLFIADGEFVALLYNPNLSRYEMLWRSQAPGITAASVGQNELKTASGTSSFVGIGSVVLPGGEYGFWAQHFRSAGAANQVVIHNASPLGTYATTIGTIAGTGTMQYRQRYMTASPPYDLGDGDIPMFVFVKVKDGAIVGTYVAQDPPWAYNGPTDIRGQLMTIGEDVLDTIEPRKVKSMKPDEQGKLRRVVESVAVSNPSFTRRKNVVKRMRRDMGREFGIDKVIDGTITMTEFSAQPVSESWVPIDNDFKNSDMGLVPHAFTDNDGVILLDPVGTLALLEMHGQGVNLSELLMDGYIEIGAEIPSAIAPPNVAVHAFSFKNT